MTVPLYSGDRNTLYLYKTVVSLKVIVGQVVATKHLNGQTLFMESSYSGHGVATVTSWTSLLGGIWHPGSWWALSPKQLKVWHTADDLPQCSAWTHINKPVRSSTFMKCSDVSDVFVWKTVHLQDGRVGAPLAGLDVAYHSFFRDWVVVETKAALLRASATHTCKQTAVSEQLGILKENTHRLTCVHHLLLPFFVPFLISCWPPWR